MSILLWVLAGALLVALTVAFLLRRRFLLSGLGAVTMWRRVAGSENWQVGVAWYSGDSLNWYRAVSLSVRPQQRLRRSEFEVESRRRAAARDRALPPDTVVLICRTDAGVQELAIEPTMVTGFLSWIESAPPSVR